MISPAYIMAFIGALVGLIIGLIVYAEITPALDCPNSGSGQEACERAISTGWAILGIFPVMFWFGFLGFFSRITGSQQQQ